MNCTHPATAKTGRIVESTYSNLRPGDHPKGRIEVRPVRSEVELDEVYRLTHDAFVEQEYCRPQPDGRFMHCLRFDRIPETTVFIALRHGRIIGSLSVTLDGPEGLPVEVDFDSECDRIRQEGSLLANGWRMVTRKQCRASRRLVFAMLREGVGHCREAGVRTCLHCVNPKHERAYQKLLKWKTVARHQEACGLQNAKAVLMRMDEDGLGSWLVHRFEQQKVGAVV